MFEDFKKFIMRGNVVDLAVGVVIGAAFGKITTSLVDQIIMPPIGLLLGGIDFSAMKMVLKEAGADPKAMPEVAIQYGAFINTVIQFMVIAFVIFMIVKAINAMRREEAVAEAAPNAPPPPSTTDLLLIEIRDSLRATPKPAAAPKPAAISKPAAAPKAPTVAKVAPAKAAPAKAASVKKSPAQKAPAKKPAAKKAPAKK